MVFTKAFEKCHEEIYIQYRTAGKLFNLRRPSAKSAVSQTMLRELLYADDWDIVAHSEEDMQHIMDVFSEACTALGLTFSLKKDRCDVSTSSRHFLC